MRVGWRAQPGRETKSADGDFTPKEMPFCIKELHVKQLCLTELADMMSWVGHLSGWILRFLVPSALRIYFHCTSAGGGGCHKVKK